MKQQESPAVSLAVDKKMPFCLSRSDVSSHLSVIWLFQVTVRSGAVPVARDLSGVADFKVPGNVVQCASSYHIGEESVCFISCLSCLPLW